MADIDHLMHVLRAATGKDVGLRRTGEVWVVELLGTPGLRPEKTHVGDTAVEALTLLATELDHEARAEMERASALRRKQVELRERLAAVLDQEEAPTDG